MTVVDRIFDSRPVRSSTPFRWLWIGTTTSAFGHQIALVAVLLQVWQLTGSPAWVGAMGLARAVPMIGCGLIGGALADGHDRRRLVMWATAGSVVGLALLAGQAMASLDSLPLILGLVAAQAASSGFGAPARRTFVPRLLPRDQITAGIALTHVSFQAAMLAGPALAGLIAAGWGVAACYLVGVATACVAWYGLARVPAMPPTGQVAGPQIQAIVAGLRLVAHRPVLRGSFITDLAATLLAMPVALFPAVNEAQFGGDPRTLGLFLSAIAVGGLAAGVTSCVITRHPHPGRVMLVAASVWGAGLAGFGLATPLWLALGCLAMAGAADTVSVIARGAIVQLATPDSHRGRVSAVDNLVGVAGPDVGNFRGGLVAGLTSPAFALVSGGLICVLGVATVAFRNPALRCYNPNRQGD